MDSADNCFHLCSAAAAAAAAVDSAVIVDFDVVVADTAVAEIVGADSAVPTQ